MKNDNRIRKIFQSSSSTPPPSSFFIIFFSSCSSSSSSLLSEHQAQGLMHSPPPDGTHVPPPTERNHHAHAVARRTVRECCGVCIVYVTFISNPDQTRETRSLYFLSPMTGVNKQPLEGLDSISQSVAQSLVLIGTVLTHPTNKIWCAEEN